MGELLFANNFIDTFCEIWLHFIVRPSARFAFRVTLAFRIPVDSLVAVSDPFNKGCVSSFSSLLSGLELSDTQVDEP